MDRATDDLIWYYSGECMAAIGFGASSMAESAGHSEYEGPSDRTVDATTRLRKIEHAVHRLSHDNQLTLRLSFTPIPPGLAPLRAVVGDVAALVLHTTGTERIAELLADGKGRSARLLRAMGAMAREAKALAIKEFKHARR